MALACLGSYGHYINSREPRVTEVVVLSFVSITLAVLSLYLIEKPFRKCLWSPIQAVRAGAFLVVFCSAIYVDSADGFPQGIFGRSLPDAQP